MSLRRINTLLLVCLLTIGLLANLATASGYVWCVSADSEHAALEFVPAGECSRNDCLPSTDEIAATTFEKDDGCGPCQDISSTHPWGTSRNDPRSTLVPPANNFIPSSATTGTFLAEPFLDTHHLAASPPRLADAIRHHRTTVLLI